jgi:hypothetical protein
MTRSIGTRQQRTQRAERTRATRCHRLTRDTNETNSACVMVCDTSVSMDAIALDENASKRESDGMGTPV